MEQAALLSSNTLFVNLCFDFFTFLPTWEKQVATRFDRLNK